MIPLLRSAPGLNPITTRTAAAIAVLAVTSLALGAALGAHAGWGLFSAGLIALILFHLRYLRALRRWQRDPRADNVPEALGVWDEVFALLYRREQAHARRKGELADALARFHQATQALPDGAVMLDSQDHIIWCNQTAERHFGLNAATDTGQPVRNLVRQPEFVAYLDEGDYARPLTLRLRRETELVLAVALIPFGEAQKLLHSRDVTQFERLDRVRHDFVANVSHELRTPLTVLAGFLETVRELKLDPERQRHYLGLMDDQSRRMHRIVEDLLTLSALESAAAPPDDQRVLIRALLSELKSEAETLSANRHRITLDVQGDFDLFGADSEIRSAFSNLVTNAVRYTPAGGEIELLWRASPGAAAFTVADTGIGIEKEDIPRLTERFYRVDRGRSRETGGTGLGLAIAKHALARHQAALEIESEPGRGSRFTARFPGQRVIAGATQAQMISR